MTTHPINRPHKGDKAMTDPIATPAGESVLLSKAQAAGVDLTRLLEAIPEADENAYVGIIAQLMAAETVADLERPWSLDGLDAYVDRWIEVRGLRQMPSDFAEGLGFYLILDAKVADSGEIVTVSTGSVSTVVQLVKAYAMGAFPVTVRPKRAARPSRNGYTPMHLEFARVGDDHGAARHNRG